MINLVRRLLAWLMPPIPGPLPAFISEPEPEPEPVTDPFDPAWRPDGEYVLPLFFERATPAPPTWTWATFTEAWPVIK